MQQRITAVLSITELFDGMTPTQLELIASICESGQYHEGDVLLRENESSDEMYIIARGSVQILMNPGMVSDGSEADLEPVLLTELRQGQVFGEIAMVDQGIRSATVVVNREDTILFRIARQRLILLCDSYPELGYKLMRNLAADLAFKIRNTDLTIRQYQLMLSQRDRHAG
ncbi:MAG: cyclic nucleotide-binding domain-containing protein [Anaerolineae bacterium]